MSKALPPHYDQIHELVTAQLEEPEGSSSSQALQDLVSENPAARRTYIQYMQELLHITARLAMPAPDAETSVAETRPAVQESSLFSQTKLAAFVTISALLLLGAFTWRSAQVETAKSSIASTEEAAQEKLHGHEVATLIKSNSAVWDSPGPPIKELSRLKVGQELRLSEGSIEVVFDSGVEALVLAPCQLTIHNASKVSSKYGRLSAKVGEQGKGFVIETPVARVTDLGTQFGVDISESGQTEVAVFEGEVDLEFGTSTERSEVPGKQRGKNLLVQGEGLRIDQFGKPTRLVSVDGSRLPTVRQLPPVFLRPPVIAEVRDNNSERDPGMRKFYRVVHSGLREDSLAFVDRPHQWNGIGGSGLPDYLVGADYVLPFNDDKFAADLSVEVLITRPANVYVFLSSSIAVPEWLTKDFIDTGQKIGLDEGPNRFRKKVALGSGPGVSVDTLFSVWKREVHQPQRVQLGAVKKPEALSAPKGNPFPGYNMYGIAAVAL